MAWIVATSVISRECNDAPHILRLDAALFWMPVFWLACSSIGCRGHIYTVSIVAVVIDRAHEFVLEFTIHVPLWFVRPFVRHRHFSNYDAKIVIQPCMRLSRDNRDAHPKKKKCDNFHWKISSEKSCHCCVANTRAQATRQLHTPYRRSNFAIFVVVINMVLLLWRIYYRCYCCYYYRGCGGILCDFAIVVLVSISRHTICEPSIRVKTWNGGEKRNTRSIDVTNDLRVSYVNHLRWLVSIAPICVTTAQRM